MKDLSHSEIHKRVEALERRLERRRARLLDESHEAVDAATHVATRALPIAAAAVGAGLLAMWLTRRRRPLAPRNATARRGVRWASLAGILGSAVRIGSSPQARLVWSALRRRRGTRY